MDAPNQRLIRTAARNWRTSSARRAAKLGRVLENVPSIDEVETALTERAKVCTYCQAPVDFTKKRRMNLDHALPISRGGGAQIANMVVACGPCNRAKGEQTAEEYLALRALVATGLTVAKTSWFGSGWVSIANAPKLHSLVHVLHTVKYLLT